MMSLETSSWVSRKTFLMLIISLNCASNLMCHLRFRYSAHAQDLNNWLNVHTELYRLAPQKKNLFWLFYEIIKENGTVSTTQLEILLNTWREWFGELETAWVRITAFNVKVDLRWYFFSLLMRALIQKELQYSGHCNLNQQIFEQLKSKFVLIFK